MKKHMSLSKLDLIRSIVCESFYEFVKYFWATVVPETPIWNWHIRVLCDEVQEVMERVILRENKKYDLIINISPGSTKSTICSVMLPAWCWAKDPTLRAICGSYAYPLSLHLASYNRSVLQSDKFLELFPDVKLIEAQKSLMVNDAGGQRIATSTGGSITGMHGHVLIVDDPINPKEALSETMLQAANDWIDQTLMTRKVDRRITPTILIMQRLHQVDPTGHLLEMWERTAIRHICLPAELDKTVRPRRLRSNYVDGLMDPIRLSANVLRTARKELGPYAFAGQYQQSPIPLGGAMFKVGNCTIIPLELAGKGLTVRYWDKAGTPGGKGPFTVGVKMVKRLDGRFVVLDVRRGRWGTDERERTMKQTAVMDGRSVVIAIEQEPGSGGKESAQASVRNLAGFRVVLDRPVGDKVLRADPYSVQVNYGNVSVVKGEWTIAYLEELRFFPFGKYGDQVDSSSGAFAHLTKARRKVGALR